MALPIAFSFLESDARVDVERLPCRSRCTSRRRHVVDVVVQLLACVCSVKVARQQLPSPIPIGLSVSRSSAPALSDLFVGNEFWRKIRLDSISNCLHLILVAVQEATERASALHAGLRYLKRQFHVVDGQNRSCWFALVTGSFGAPIEREPAWVSHKLVLVPFSGSLFSILYI